MEPDARIKSRVLAELLWEPAVDATHVGVAVEDGIVTLSGSVRTAAEKHAAECAVRRVWGVRGLAVELEVKLDPAHRRSDTDIAATVLRALRWNSSVPAARIQVQVEDGCVTLTGDVDWSYQRLEAERCVRSLLGVRSIVNAIGVTPRAGSREVAAEIAAAFARHAARQANHIAVDVEGGVVTLTGEVDSLAEHDAAVGTAFATQGVERVVDRLYVAH